MIFGDRIAKTKLVEQLTLVTLQTAHHGSTSPRIASTQRNHRSWPHSNDFCNKIDPKRTSTPSPAAVDLRQCRATCGAQVRRWVHERLSEDETAQARIGP